jgi:hypothetical protein
MMVSATYASKLQINLVLPTSRRRLRARSNTRGSTRPARAEAWTTAAFWSTTASAVRSFRATTFTYGCSMH